MEIPMPRRRKKHFGARTLLLIGVLAFALGACSGIGIYSFWMRISPGEGSRPEWQEDIQRWLENAQGALVNIAAVRSEPKLGGVICTLAVKVAPGNGYIYISIDPMLVGFDFQDADRKAVMVACKETGYSLDGDGVGIRGYDVFFMVLAPTGEEVDVQAIDGPSAGAATTLATIAALKNRQIKEGYIITGTVEEDGSIGPVGGIFYKAEAAKNAGATHFLVPPGQSVVTMYQQVVRQIGPFQWVTYEPVRVDLNQYAQERDWNLEIQEVSTIGEAVGIMLT